MMTVWGAVVMLLDLATTRNSTPTRKRILDIRCESDLILTGLCNDQSSSHQLCSSFIELHEAVMSYSIKTEYDIALCCSEKSCFFFLEMSAKLDPYIFL